jgi:hypothetical protein
MRTALDALSPSNPWVASAARGIGGGSSDEGNARGAAQNRPGKATAKRSGQWRKVEVAPFFRVV